MITKELSDEIREAAQDLTQKELMDFLYNLDCDEKIHLDYDGWYYAIDFASYMVDRMKKSLDKGHWYGYEANALNALDNIPGDEYEVVWIDAYGYPREIRDNDHLLHKLGISEQLIK